ncbi:hypothetical protein B0H14DRAFT_1358925 [Mycena olivaceomarginata]|nr:hypothetical protein B0H14DRAFT_1358925 [Mycena olivaceomarginata]
MVAKEEQVHGILSLVGLVAGVAVQCFQSRLLDISNAYKVVKVVQGATPITRVGQGGTGYAPEFSELLCTIDTETRLRVSNVKLWQTGKLRAAGFDISDTLNSLLQQCGFETMCGLFHVQENDLPESIFKRGHRLTLKRALTEFRRNVATQSRSDVVG